MTLFGFFPCIRFFEMSLIQRYLQTKGEKPKSAIRQADFGNDSSISAIQGFEWKNNYEILNLRQILHNINEDESWLVPLLGKDKPGSFWRIGCSIISLSPS